MEDYKFKRRNRLKKHFVNTSLVLLYGYKAVSDSAKITYQVIDSFDWEDKETQTSKGYAFPSVRTIAKIRGVSDRTVQRHLTELVAAELLTKVERVGEPSLLIIEEVSDQEANSYLEKYSRGDKNVTTPTTEMSPQYKTEELKEDKENVNEIHLTGGTENSEPEPLKDILERLQKFRTAKKKPPERAKRDYLAGEMVRELGDEESLGCYRAIAEKVPEAVIFEALGLVKEAAREGRIRRSRGALFVDIIKRFADGRGIDLKFKSESGREVSDA